MKIYTVHSIFRTVQGEGCNIGTPAVFVRFAGCNLWSGREQDRANAICQFCDTDFRGGIKYTRDELVARIRETYYAGLIVFTGGEPGLQLDQELVDILHKRYGYTVAIETNGTVPIPAVQWVCVSPKAGTKIVIPYADEMKLVFPQGPRMTPDFARSLVRCTHFWLSPMDGPDLERNIKLAFDYVTKIPLWRLNIQAHKVWNVA